MRVPLTALALTPLLSLALARSTNAQELRGRTLAEWRALIEPAEDELSWRAISWRATLWEAVREARDEDKPLLVWAMNGHPLGCV